MEVKAIAALLLQRFDFGLQRGYRVADPADADARPARRPADRGAAARVRRLHAARPHPARALAARRARRSSCRCSCRVERARAFVPRDVEVVPVAARPYTLGSLVGRHLRAGSTLSYSELLASACAPCAAGAASAAGSRTSGSTTSSRSAAAARSGSCRRSWPSSTTSDGGRPLRGACRRHDAGADRRGCARGEGVAAGRRSLPMISGGDGHALVHARPVGRSPPDRRACASRCRPRARSPRSRMTAGAGRLCGPARRLVMPAPVRA